MDELGERLRDAPDGEVGPLLEKAGRVTSWPAEEKARGWARLEVDLGGRARQTHVSLMSWATAAMATGIFLAFLGTRWAEKPVTPTRWERLELAGIGELEVQQESQLRLPADLEEPRAEREIFLDSGILRAHVVPQAAGRRVAVITPQVRVEVVGTRFRVAVESEHTEVEVEEGQVRVEATTHRQVLLGAGDRLRSDDARLASAATSEESTKPAPTPIATAIIPAPPPEPELAPEPPLAPGPISASAAAHRRVKGTVETCSAEAILARRRDCYLAFVAEDGLSGQNAMYSLGRLEREAGDHEKAIEYWSMYSRRYPDGALGPEVSRNLLGEHLALGRHDDALRETEEFLERFSADSHRSEVQLTRAGLLCSAGRTAEALVALEEVLASPRPPIRNEALFAKARCLLAAGQARAGRQALEQYVAEFPAGEHAAEARRLLGK